jgi:autotransporter-associated beta strand protein
MRPSSLAPLCADLVVGICGKILLADILTWDGGIVGSTPQWSDPTNWVTDVAPTDGDSLIFAGSTQLINENDLFQIILRRLEFASNAGAFTLGGSGITMVGASGTAAAVVNNSSVQQILDFTDVALEGVGAVRYAEINPGAGGLRITGLVDMIDLTIMQARFIGEAGGTLELLGGVASSGAIGSSVRVDGNIVVKLAGFSSYTGETEVVRGELQVLAGSTLATSQVSLGGTSGTAAAKLTLGDTDGGQDFGEVITVRAGSTGKKTVSSLNTSGTNTLSGVLTLNDDLTLETLAGGTLAVSSSSIDLKNKTLTVTGTGGVSITVPITNSVAGGRVIKEGNGTLTLSGISTFTGGIELRAGTVSAGDAVHLGAVNSPITFAGGTLNVNETFAIPLARPVSTTSTASTISVNIDKELQLDTAISGTGGIRKTGVGTLLLGGAQTYTGLTTVEEGTLRSGANDRLRTTAQVRVAGGIYDLGGFTQTLGTLNVVAGTVTGLTNARITASSLLMEGGTVSIPLAGSGGLSKSGTGTATLTASNLYTGTVTISGGLLQVANDAGFGATSNPIVLNGGGFINNTSITNTRTVTTQSAGSGVGAGSGQTVTFNTAITGAGSLTKYGLGIVSFTAVQGYAGETIVQAGALRLAAAAGNSIPAMPLRIVADSVTNFDAATVQLSLPNQIPDTVPVFLSASGGKTATFDLNGQSDTVGSLDLTTATGANTGSLVRVGAGTLTLNGNINFHHNFVAVTNTGRELLITGTGSIASAVTGGTLNLGGQTRTITVDTTNPGTNPLATNNNATIETIITNGGITKTGSSISALVLTAPNTYAGGTTIAAGSLLANNTSGSATGTGAVTVNAGARFGGTGAVTGAVTVNGTIAPGITRESLGTGSLTMNNGSTFSVDLAGATHTTLYDVLAVTGTVTLNSPTLAINLTYDPVDFVDRFFILQNDGTDPISGTFLNLPEGQTFTVGGQIFRITYQGDFTTNATTGGNDVLLMAIPEPGTPALVVGAVLFTAASVRRRRANRAARS